MNSTFPGQDFPDEGIDEGRALAFLTEFRSLEQALIRAGFTRPGLLHGNVQADWVRFVRHIEQRFRLDPAEELQAAVDYLLCDPDQLRRRRERLQDSYPGETCGAESDIVWLSEMIEQTANKLTHGLGFLRKTGLDDPFITAAQFVVTAWSGYDPTVASLLKYVQ
jgi:hypothetical protein